jgi:hypothetical protein
VLDIIERFTWGDSVFLADQLPSFSLPAYPNRPAFMGRWWWHLGRDVYQKILSGALALRRTTDPEQIAADRLEAVCTVTHLDTDVQR